MELCRHVDLCEADAITEAETQDAWVGLHASTDVQVFNRLIFQSSAQADAFKVCVFLNLTLSDEVLGELVGHTETKYDG